MFTLLILAAVLTALCAIGILFLDIDIAGRIMGAVFLSILTVVLTVVSFKTPEGAIKWNQFTASGAGATWLVVDNSGGETLRHWILEDRFVKSASNSDGWEFTDASGNNVYVSGDSFVLQIKQDLETFKQDYKSLYNIPQDLPVLK